MCDILNAVKTEIEAIENESKDIYEAAKPTLFNLPVEIFLEICSFLDADFISKTLSKVCRRFEGILADIQLWKYWVKRRIKSSYPALPHLIVWKENEVNWEDACIEIDKEYMKWTNDSERIKHIVVKDVHFASVDAVLLVNNGEICLSGGRDRGLALWKVSSLTPHNNNEATETCVNAKPDKMLPDAHYGWVWDLAADSPDAAKIIYSASWDNTVKAWDLETGLTHLQTFQCNMSALSVVTSGNLVFTGLFSKKVLIFDNRVGPEAITSYKSHRGPVLALDTRDGLVASVSEDKTLAIWDRKACKTLTSDVKIQSERAYPVCISWSPAALYVGDSKGRIHLVDPEEFRYCDNHTLWPEPEITLPASKVTGIHQGLGTMIVCSDRGDIKYLYNSYPPQEYMALKSSTYDVTKLQYQNEILVLGTCDSALEFWIPADRF